mmetsp:Transcript_5428/g.12553  ORF Transcript_5428/g.12553 Transcript_5428/m.12553 type:complete len:246 (+) Transcript_5428:934-1671(+)
MPNIESRFCLAKDNIVPMFLGVAMGASSSIGLIDDDTTATAPKSENLPADRDLRACNPGGAQFSGMSKFPASSVVAKIAKRVLWIDCFKSARDDLKGDKTPSCFKSLSWSLRFESSSAIEWIMTFPMSDDTSCVKRSGHCPAANKRNESDEASMTMLANSAWCDIVEICSDAASEIGIVSPTARVLNSDIPNAPLSIALLNTSSTADKDAAALSASIARLSSPLTAVTSVATTPDGSNDSSRWLR